MSAKRVPPNVWKGALAGLAGGLAGIAAKAVVNKLLPPTKQPSTTPLPASLVAGAVYGVAAEFTPGVKSWQGATFGLLLRRLAGAGVLPGVPPRVPTGDAAPERLQSWAGNLAFGVAAEATRRAVRRGL